MEHRSFWQVEQFTRSRRPEQKKKFEQAVREHRIGLDAMYGSLLTGLARGEELLRQMESPRTSDATAA